MTQDDALRAPYPGLRAFRREETDLFFGREDSINAMVDRLAATRFLAVLGSSGTGKSSLVKTGLLDALELGLMAKAGSRWKIVEFRPGGAPLKNLARELLEAENPDQAIIPQKDIDLLRAYLARGPRSVIEWCRSGHLPDGTNLLLLVDQFEELFRYQDYAGREEAEAFAALLLESAREKDVPIYVTITMRSEYLGACALIEGVSDAINAGMFLTPRMTREQCREAIVGPAAVCNIEIEPALVNRLLNDLANFAPWDDRDSNDQFDRIMRRADQLPLLQYTLNRMWLRARKRTGGDQRIKLTVDDYLAIGGLSGALNAHANQIFEELGKARWPVVEWIFRALTAGSTIADAVRRPTRFDDLVSACGGDEASVRAVVDAFRAPGVNFLVPEYDGRNPIISPDTYVDISHESLIRQWKKLSEWLEAEGRAAQQWRRLIDRYGTGELLRGRELANLVAWRRETKPNAAWAKRYGGDYSAVISFLDRSQRTQNRKRALMIASAAAVFILMAAQAVVATYLNSVANENLVKAETALTRVAQMFSEVEAERQRAEEQRKVAEEQRKAAEEQRKRAEANAKSYELLTGIIDTLVFNIVRPVTSTDRRTSQTGGGSGPPDTTLAVAMATLEGIRKLTAAYPNDNNIKRYLTVVLNMYGDVKLRSNDIETAAKAFEESLAVVRALLRDDPDKSLWQDDLALALARVGQVQTRRNRHEEARKHYQEAIEIDRRLVNATPKVERLLNNLQVHLGQYGEVLVKLNDKKAALEVYTERLDIRRKLLSMTPGNSQRMEDTSIALDRVGQLIREAGDVKNSRQYFEEALDIDRALHRRDPNRREWRENLVFSLRRLGDVDRQVNNYPTAIKFYEEALGHQRVLVAADPAGAGPQRTLALLIKDIGYSHHQLKQYPEALKAYREELDIRRKLLARNRKDVRAQRDLATALDHVGNTLREMKDIDGARKAFIEQLEVDRQLVLAEPENASRLLDYAWSLGRIGDLERQVKQLPDALRYYTEALDVRRRTLALETNSVVRQRALASILNRIGSVKRQLKDYPGALQAHQEELSIRRKLLEREPKGLTERRDVASALDAVGNTLREMKNIDGARKFFTEQIGIDRQLISESPDNDQRLLDLIWSLNRLGDLERGQNRWAEAEKLYDEGLPVQRKLVAHQPNNVGRLRALATLLGRIGEAKTRTKNLPAALSPYRELVELRRDLAKRNDQDVTARRDLSLALDYLGNTLRDTNDLTGALAAFQEELAVDRETYRRHPETERQLLDMAWTLNKVGDFQRRLKDLPGARKSFEEMLEFERKLLARSPADKERNRKLHDGLSKLAQLLVEMDDIPAAKQTYDAMFQADERWLAIARERHTKSANADTRSDLVQAYGDAGWNALLSGRSKLSVQYCEAALKLDGTRTWIRVNLGHAYLFLGRIEDAKKVYIAVRDIDRSADGKRKYSHEIRDDFVLFRKLGIGVPAMDRMAREIGI
ncbi:MAG: tetratricopeptide repeat protein [Xanthobacteraceae bacterium]